jgi:hypothetical protein|tara:strand:+ start:188 stop:337 length:150 start_codon:yes stop_codon:yes gene_type:complete
LRNYKNETSSNDKTSKCSQEPNDNIEPVIRGEEEQLEFDFMNDGSLGFD